MKKIITFEKSLQFPSMIGEITSITLDQQLEFKSSNKIDGNLLIKGTYKRTEASRLEEDFSFELPTEIILTERLDISSSKVDIDDFYYRIESDNTINCHIDVLIEGIEVIDLEENNIEDDEKEMVLKEHKKNMEQIVLKEDDGIPLEDEDVELLRECDGDASYESLEDNVEEKDLLAEGNNSDSQVLELKEKENNQDLPKFLQEQSELELENNKIYEKEENIDMKSIVEDNKKEKNIVVDGENVGSLFTSLKDSEETFSTYAVYIVRQEETIENIIDKYNITKEELENYNDISSISIGSKIIIPLKNE